MPEEGRSPAVIRLLRCECPRRLENYSEVLCGNDGRDVLLICCRSVTRPASKVDQTSGNSRPSLCTPTSKLAVETNVLLQVERVFEGRGIQLGAQNKVDGSGPMLGDPGGGECACSVTTDFTARGSNGKAISTVPAS
jgi:hypothetical protein